MGSLQVSPPSVDVDTRMAEVTWSADTDSAIWYALPSVSNVTQGSDARSSTGSPPEHSLNAAKLSVQVSPPSKELAATRPRAPPLDQRSCWNTPMRLAGFVGLTATNGSTSAVAGTDSVPGSGGGAAPTVQPANGLGPEAGIGASTPNG